VIKKPLIIPFLITLIFSTFSPIAIHSANAVITKTATASGVQYGGAGGTASTPSCANNSVVTSITRGKYSAYDSFFFGYFSITCTDLDDQGALLNTTNYPAAFSGIATDTTTVTCSTGYAATGMQIYGKANNGGGFVGAVNLICQPFPGGGTAVTVGTDTSSGSGSNPGSSTCAAGSFMTGANARGGSGLDAVGAACSSFTGYTYSITYSGNGSTSGTVPSVQSGSGTVTLATNTGTLAKTGSYFNGWNTAADGTGTAYAVSASYTLSASVTLYAKWVVITLATINNKLLIRVSETATATPAVAFVYTASGTCTVNSSSGLVTFTGSGSCTITATYGGGSAAKTFTIIDNLTQRIISRSGVQPNAVSTFVPTPYLTLPPGRSENVYACLAIVGATGATILTSTNLNISLFTLSGATMSTADTGKSYTITGTLAQVQAALSTLKMNSTSGRIMAANSGSIYLRVRANLIADATTDTQCLDIGNDARITLYQYTSDQVRRKNVPQKSGSTP
jgi:Listeria-Bacteroides repeat domain (List_Bact_rpt)